MLIISGSIITIGNFMEAKKSLGQHWLNHAPTLERICEVAELASDDTVLEIGPGHGSLTKYLVKQVKKVIAVELDPALVDVLKNNPANNLEVIEADIMKFNLEKLPANYKVVANIPYYLTSNLIRVLSESSNPPSLMVLLVQKEVAQRIAAAPGMMSILSVSVQLYYRPELELVVPAALFEPAPKVDSQIVVLRRHPKPLLENLDEKEFFRVVKAGFSEKRKKLRSSLSGGLGIDKAKADELLKAAGIDPDARAQELSLNQWYKLYKKFH